MMPVRSLPAMQWNSTAPSCCAAMPWNTCLDCAWLWPSHCTSISPSKSGKWVIIVGGHGLHVGGSSLGRDGLRCIGDQRVGKSIDEERIAGRTLLLRVLVEGLAMRAVRDPDLPPTRVRALLADAIGRVMAD